MATVLKEGFLIKQGDRVKSWKKRYFVVKHDTAQLKFEYFKSPGSELLGTFFITDISQFRTIESPPNCPVEQTVMEIFTPARVYWMTSESEADLREWAWAIEKTLQYLKQLVPNMPIAKQVLTGLKASFQGFLYKKGYNRRNWKKRWFVLGERMLRYYSNKGDKAPLGTINLDRNLGVHKINDYTSSSTPQQRFVFTVAVPTRTYFIAAQSEAELEEWLRALVRAGCEVSQASITKKSTFYDEEKPGASSDSDDDGGGEDDDGNPSHPPALSSTSSSSLTAIAAGGAAGAAGAASAAGAGGLSLSSAGASSSSSSSMLPASSTASLAFRPPPFISRFGLNAAFSELHDAFRPMTSVS